MAWNADTGGYEATPTRSADAYVFCHYPEKGKTRVNVLDLAAWDFYVVSVDVLNRECSNAKSVALKSVQRVAARCKFDELRRTVDGVLARGGANERYMSRLVAGLKAAKGSSTPPTAD